MIRKSDNEITDRGWKLKHQKLNAEFNKLNKLWLKIKWAVLEDIFGRGGAENHFIFDEEVIDYLNKKLKSSIKDFEG